MARHHALARSLARSRPIELQRARPRPGGRPKPVDLASGSPSSRGATLRPCESPFRARPLGWQRRPSLRGGRLLAWRPAGARQPARSLARILPASAPCCLASQPASRARSLVERALQEVVRALGGAFVAAWRRGGEETLTGTQLSWPRAQSVRPRDNERRPLTKPPRAKASGAEQPAEQPAERAAGRLRQLQPPPVSSHFGPPRVSPPRVVLSITLTNRYSHSASLSVIERRGGQLARVAFYLWVAASRHIHSAPAPPVALAAGRPQARPSGGSARLAKRPAGQLASAANSSAQQRHLRRQSGRPLRHYCRRRRRRRRRRSQSRPHWPVLCRPMRALEIGCQIGREQAECCCARGAGAP